ncbi:hypothetical protein DMI65_16540 [Escherichia coli]|nr:hypothetical protein [Escherichia coli]
MKELVDKLGTRLNQLFCGDTIVKGITQPTLESIDMGFIPPTVNSSRASMDFAVDRAGGESGVCVLFWKGIHLCATHNIKLLHCAGIRRLHLFVVRDYHRDGVILA